MIRSLETDCLPLSDRMDSSKECGGDSRSKRSGQRIVWKSNESGADSPYKEELELLQVRSDLRLDGTIMRQAMKAGGKAGDWADLVESDRLNWSASAKLCENATARWSVVTRSGKASCSRCCRRAQRQIIVPLEGLHLVGLLRAWRHQQEEK